MVMIDSRSQRARILELLIRAHGDWVPLPKIAACAAQYNARIYELRRLRFRIVNRTQEVNGIRHSWFRLESGPVQANCDYPLLRASGLLNPLPLFKEASDA